jgi:hypothetical protein
MNEKAKELIKECLACFVDKSSYIEIDAPIITLYAKLKELAALNESESQSKQSDAYPQKLEVVLCDNYKVNLLIFWPDGYIGQVDDCCPWRIKGLFAEMVKRYNTVLDQPEIRPESEFTTFWRKEVDTYPVDAAIPENKFRYWNKFKTYLLQACDIIDHLSEEKKQFKEAIKYLRDTYSPYDGRPCPVCEYVDGKLIKLCKLHEIIDRQTAEIANMRTYSHETVKGLVDHRDATIDQQAERIKVLTGALDDLVSEHVSAGSDIADCVNDHLKAALAKAQKVLENE